MKFKITQKDIDKARKLQSGKNTIKDNQCPVAFALARKTHKKVRVRNYVIVINSDVGVTIYPVPLLLKNFIDNFDDGQIVYPGNFEIKHD